MAWLVLIVKPQIHQVMSWGWAFKIRQFILFKGMAIFQNPDQFALTLAVNFMPRRFGGSLGV